tara:strand:+ start:231 stop:482 length:252 start_codon:yes stop_codon:yes gene_type:complete
MISFDRETLTIVAVILCIAATVYMYKEFTQAKSDIEGIKGFCNKIVQAHTPPPPPTQQRVIQEHDEEEEEEVVINNVAESKEN